MLSRLAANLTRQLGGQERLCGPAGGKLNTGSNEEAMKEEATEASSLKQAIGMPQKVSAMKLKAGHDRDAWNTVVVGGGALVACLVAWAASSAV